MAEGEIIIYDRESKRANEMFKKVLAAKSRANMDCDVSIKEKAGSPAIGFSGVKRPERILRELLAEDALIGHEI